MNECPYLELTNLEVRRKEGPENEARGIYKYDNFIQYTNSQETPSISRNSPASAPPRTSAVIIARLSSISREW